MMKYALIALFVAAASATNYHNQDFCKGRELDHHYKHPEDCGKFIACDQSGRAIEMPCVSGLHYMLDDTRWGHCDYPHIANCEDGHENPEPGHCGNSPASIKSFTCEGKAPGNYRNPNDCCSYIACSPQHKPTYMKCVGNGGSGNLHWDWSSLEAPADCSDQYDGQCLGQCNYPELANCGSNQGPECEGNKCNPLSWWSRCCEGTSCLPGTGKWAFRWTCQVDGSSSSSSSEEKIQIVV